MWQRARSGDWVTRAWVRPAGLLMAIAAVAVLVALRLGGHGTLDGWGRPIGTDFSNVWTAGRMALDGRAALAWDWPAHYRMQQAVHGPGVPFYGWHYPPPFLLVAAPLALLPYLPAYYLWQAATLGAATLVVRRIRPSRGTVLATLGYPATYVCLTHGQNGFLTAALLGGGLHLLAARPAFAGVLLGCLCYKPQFAPVVPVLLVAGRHWRALGAAAAAAMAIVALTLATWGVAAWHAFGLSLPLTRTVIIEEAGAGAFKLVSVFAAVRMGGGGVSAAYLAQGIAATAALAGIVLARRSPLRIRGAGAIAASLLATPYAFDYDMVPLGVATAFLVAEAERTGWRDWERSALALVAVAPLVGRGVAQTTGVPLDLVAVVALWAVALRRTLPAPAATTPALTPSPCRR